MTRRGAVACLAGALGATAVAAPRKPPTWPICVHSRALARVGYAELGDIVKQLGFDGIDLTVMPGGHVNPALSPVDMVRAIESIHGAELALPIISTAFLSASEPWARNVLALSGRSGVGIFKPGASSRQAPGLRGLAMVASQYDMVMAVPLGPADQGFASEDVPAWASVALSAQVSSEVRDAVLPRVKAVSVWDANSSGFCPLGQGKVDLAGFFAALFNGGFEGPVTLERRYPTKDEPGSLSRDLDFLRKHVAAASLS